MSSIGYMLKNIKSVYIEYILRLLNTNGLYGGYIYHTLLNHEKHVLFKRTRVKSFYYKNTKKLDTID